MNDSANRDLRPPDLGRLIASSIDVIRAYQHPSGGYTASPNFAVYRYCWLRDGSFIADAMSRVGHPASARSFFDWAANVLRDRAAQVENVVSRARGGELVHDAELLPTRYELDGRDGVEPWANFQLDGYGTLLFVLVAHAERHGLSLDPYRDVIGLTVDYLATFGTRPCFDWWEEAPDERHTSTLGAVFAGLCAAARSGVLDNARMTATHTAAAEILAMLKAETARAGHLTKWIGSDALDGSLLACIAPFDVLAPFDPRARRTADGVRNHLVREGVYRYLGDTFYGGGEWLILTAWLGWVEAASGDRDAAMARLTWIASQATADGLLPEQVTARAQDPSAVADWERRWGTVATPLLWSHAMFLTLASVCGVID